jgi:hypothetical protein
MADYRDMAAALSGGYGQDTGPITADTLITLKNGKKATAGDLLGMIKGYGQAVGSNLESLGRGGVASVIGAGGDLESFARMGINKLYGAGGVNVSPTPVLPTSTDILGMMPRGTATRSETAGMEELGGYMTPATAKVLKPAVMATGRMAGQEINAAMTGQPTRSLLGDITPKPLQLDVYHGTPNRLPPTETNPLGEFDASKIGTGAGAQARGYGIYSSESPEFADYFAMRKKIPDVEGIASQNGLQLSRDAQVELMRQSTKDSTGKPAKGDNYIDPIAAAKKLQNASIEARQMPVEKLQNTIRDFQEQNRAYLYKADLPDEIIPKMLDLDLPLSQQNSDVKKAINNLPEFVAYSEKIMGKPINTLSGDTLQKMMLGYQAELNKSAEGAAALASEAFRKAGIPGNVYKELGVRNFVVYPKEEKRIKILERQTR